jgi:fibro-slime domain-containing protein
MTWKTAMAAAAFVGLTSAGAMGDSFQLMGTLRDFSPTTHPDFQKSYNNQFPLITQMVKPDLGPDDKPVLNYTPAGCKSISVVSSRHDLSNVVLKLDDGTEYKYDNLKQGRSGTFAVPAAHTGKLIIGCWVKAGTNESGQGPGYGQWIADDSDHVNLDAQGKITVTFTQSGGIPAQWRIASESSFKKWFTSVEGINQSIPHAITLSNGQAAPGGIYRFEASKHNGQDFFPIDNQLLGNENRPHNYHFTYEIVSRFLYTDRSTRDTDMVLSFSGDDDVWVFINRKLVVDLGGVHAERYATVNVDQLAQQIGLQPGQQYSFHFFFAERHTTESNFTLETNMPLLPAQYD